MWLDSLSPSGDYLGGIAQLGIMGWPLLACSIATLMLCLERVAFHIRARIHQNRVYGGIAEKLTRYREHDKVIRDEVASMMLAEMQSAFSRGISMLRIIGVIAPLLGLLGTILGIIKVFQVVAASSGPISPSMIAAGLWEALLTTAAGLLIALPALFLSYVFQSLGEKRISYLQTRLNHLSLSFEIQRPPTPKKGGG